MVGFLPDDLENYISAHSESGGDVEKALRKETFLLFKLKIIDIAVSLDVLGFLLGLFSKITFIPIINLR